MTSRVKCRKCPAMILEITAATYHGTCRTCARTKGARNRLKQLRYSIAACAEMVKVFLLLPFLLPYLGARRIWRRWRFPFDKRTLLQQIQRHYPDLRDARNYLSGVINGYWENAPSNVLRPGTPFDFGLDKGGLLRRGEISASTIPS